MEAEGTDDCLVDIHDTCIPDLQSKCVKVAVADNQEASLITEDEAVCIEKNSKCEEEVEGVNDTNDTEPSDVKGDDSLPSASATTENVLQIEQGAVIDGYMILHGDAAVSLGVGALEEPATKKFRFQAEDGQSYVLTVADNGGNVKVVSDKNEEVTTPEPSPVFVVADNTKTPVTTTQSHIGGSKKLNSSSDVSQEWFTTRDDKQALHNTGACWKQGQWTKEEVELLQANISKYCTEHDIGDPTEIIFEMTRDERKDFYRTIAKGLQRPLFSVYRRVTRMYDQKNYIGKYSQEEIAKLKELRRIYGNDWTSIGEALGRSASSVKDKCRLMKDTCNSGKWLPEEERRLCSAVYELAGIKQGENITSGLSWASVAEKVGTRSEKQCRTKWLNYLNWKQKGGTEWTREDEINLIYRVADLGVSDDTEIDWNELAKNWTSVRSPQWLRGKWWSIKRHVPDYQLMYFPNIVEYLKTVHLQHVQVKNQVRVSTDGTLTMPVSLQTTAGLDGATVDGEGLQAYEILHQTSSGAFLITQPQTNPAITINGSSMTTDHIIVHTLPANTALQSSEALTVQMNPPSVILSAANHDESGAVTLDSTEITNTIALQQSDHDIQTIGPTDQMISEEVTDISQTGIDTESQIISTQYESETIAGTVIESDNDASQSEIVNSSTDVSNLKLVMVTTGSTDGTELMSSLSDPMLPSGGSDLICSSSDVEGDKGHHQDNEITAGSG